MKLQIEIEKSTIHAGHEFLTIHTVIAGGFGSGKTNELLSLIRHQPDIDKIFFLAKDQYDSNYYYVIKKSEMLA